MAEETTKGGEESVVRRDTSWPRVLLYLHIHVAFVYGIYFLLQAKILTILFTLFLTLSAMLGTTAGAHRLWAHRSYAASTSLRIFLMICHTLGGTGTIYDWVLDHRIHHKFYGTSNDPFNCKRGLFYAQLGNRLMVPHPKRAELIKEIDMSDIEKDRVVMIQKRFYWILMPVINLLLTINAPVEYWGERMLSSVMAVFFRIPFMLHVTWFVNSARTVWELQPNDRFFSDSNLVFIIKKSHWHAYHYTAPWDYLTGEFGSYNCGCTTAFIKIWAVMGLAKDLKTIDSKGTAMALARSMETGESIETCLKAVRDELELYQFEDDTLKIIGNKKLDSSTAL